MAVKEDQNQVKSLWCSDDITLLPPRMHCFMFSTASLSNFSRGPQAFMHSPPNRDPNQMATAFTSSVLCPWTSHLSSLIDYSTFSYKSTFAPLYLDCALQCELVHRIRGFLCSVLRIQLTLNTMTSRD